VVYPLRPPTCSPATGQCATPAGGTASAFFTLTLHQRGQRTNISFGLDCAHSSTRSLHATGFAPIVVAAGPPAPVRGGGAGLHHDPARRNSCAGLASACPPDAPYAYGDDNAGRYCCSDAAGARAGDCKSPAGLCCLAPGHTAGCQGHQQCAAQNWTEYGNDCAGWYCSADTPRTTPLCAHPAACAGCPNTPRCRANCSGDGQGREHASCDCVDRGGVCRLLGHGGSSSAQNGDLSSLAGSRGIPVCLAKAPAAAGNLSDDIKQHLRLSQISFAASAGFEHTSPLVVYLQLQLSLAAGAPTGLSVVTTLGGSGGAALHWPAQPLRPGGAALTWAASVDVASGAGRRRQIPAATFASNLSATAAYWADKLVAAAGPRVAEARVSTAWRAWLANAFVHVRRGAGQGPRGGDLLYPQVVDIITRTSHYESFTTGGAGHNATPALPHPQDGVLFYEAVYGYSAALYASMLSRYGYPTHAAAYLDSMLALVEPSGLFTLNFGLPDHGALLLAASDHFLTTRDGAWLSSHAGGLKRMVNWVAAERAASMANQTRGSATYGLIFYRPYCDHPTPTYSYLSDTYLVLGLEAIARALRASPPAARAGGLDPAAIWRHAAAYRSDVEASMRASVVATPSGLRTVPIFPSTAELVKAGNNTARNYYVLTGSNLLEADFFNRDSVEAELIARFLEDADGLVPGTAAARFDFPKVWDDGHSRGRTRMPDGASAAPPVDPALPGKALGMDHAYTYGYWHHRLKQGDPTPAITGLYAALAFGSSSTFCSVECTLMDGSNAYTLPHLYSDTQQLRLLRDLLLFEEVERSVELGGNLSVGWGVPTQWLSEAAVSLSSAPTLFGSVSLAIGSQVSHVLTANITVEPPPDGASAGLRFVKLRLRPLPSWRRLLSSLTLNGAPSSTVTADLVEIDGGQFDGGATVAVVATFKGKVLGPLQPALPLKSTGSTPSRTRL
jgi:hypothetical protein